MAFGSLGHAQAADLSSYGTPYLQQVVNGEHPRPMVSIDDARAELQARANGKQQKITPEPSNSKSGYNKEYLQKAADPDRTGRYMISVEKAKELLKNMSEGITKGNSNDFRVGQKVIYTTSNGQKFPSIVTAVDFDEDAVKIKSANNKPFPNSGGDIEIVVDPGWKFLTTEPRVDPDSIIAVSPTMRKTTERVRDPEDWDEGNTEPPNNFAVYINGKKWKVFKGRGQFADDYKEIQHYRQLQTWAQQKSAATGKKWTVSITGEEPTA
jgi:hypothetical protein